MSQEIRKRGIKTNWPKEAGIPVKEELPARVIGLLGYGEINKAYHECYQKHSPQDEVLIRDIDRDEFKKPVQYLHVAIPGSMPDFVEVVLKAIKEVGPETLVLVHSTVPVGTVEKLAATHRLVVHVPVRGVHPHLFEGLQTFVSFVGSDFVGAGRLASEELDRLKIPNEVVYKSRTTELLKLLDTSAYGINIAFADAASKLCAKHDVKYETVMTRATETYNSGFWRLDMPQVVRPVLYPPEGKIKGHCIRTNCEILEAQGDKSWVTEAVLKVGEI